MQKQDKITVLILEPNKKAYTQKIDNTLESKQIIVGGRLDHMYLDNNCVVYFDDEFLFSDLEPNRCINGTIIMGNIIILDGSDEIDRSITPAQLADCMKDYGEAQTFSMQDIVDIAIQEQETLYRAKQQEMERKMLNLMISFFTEKPHLIPMPISKEAYDLFHHASRLLQATQGELAIVNGSENVQIVLRAFQQMHDLLIVNYTYKYAPLRPGEQQAMVEYVVEHIDELIERKVFQLIH